MVGMIEKETRYKVQGKNPKFNTEFLKRESEFKPRILDKDFHFLCLKSRHKISLLFILKTDLNKVHLHPLEIIV